MKMPIIKLSLMIGIIMLNAKISCQVESIDTLADSWANEGKQLSKNKEYNKSDSLLLMAKSAYQKNSDWHNWFSCISRLNTNAGKQRRYKSYLDSLMQFEKILPSDSILIKAKLKFKQGNNQVYLGNIYESINLYKNTLALLDKVKLSHGGMTNYKAYYKKSLSKIATGYSKYNDQISALKYINEFEKFASDKEDSCRVIRMKGRFLFYNNEKKKSYKYLKDAIRLCGGSDSKLLLADLLISMDSMDSALNLIEQINYEDGKNVDYYLAKAAHDKIKKNWTQSIFHQIQALELMKANSSFSKRSISRESIVLSQLYVKSGDLINATKLAHSVLSDYNKGLDASDIDLRPDLDSSSPDIWVIKAYFIKATYFRNLYEKSKNKKYLEEATFYYQTLFDYFDQLKNEYYADESKYSMGAYEQNIYNEIVNFYIELYNENKNDQYINSAFLLTQQSNAFVLKNAISERKMFELINLSQDSIDLYLELTSKASSQTDSSNYSVLKEYDAFKSSLTSSYPTFNNYRRNALLSIEQVQALLKEEDLVIQFQYSDSIVNIFAITKAEAKVYGRKIPANFKELVGKHINLVSNPNVWDEKDFLTNGHALYQLLLEEILDDDVFKNKKHLYIIPSGLIRNIAFSTLIKEFSERLTAENYLIWDYSISYLYYCEQLLYSENSPSDKGGFLGFGLRYEDEFLAEIKSDLKDQTIYDNSRSAALMPLRFAVDEVNKCAEYFNGKVYTNEGATLGTAMSEISNYSLIHISAHALIDNEDYLKSHIIFNKNEDEEYKMTYQDVVRSNINADFVVLSACQTGIGNLINGEGLMSLCRAFVQSGTKSVMGAYWNASDKPSSEIMQLFYQNLKQGLSKANALQLAQKAYLTDDNISSPRVRAPFYWAPWAIYGKNSSYQNKSSALSGNFKYYIIGSLFFLSIILFFIFKQKKDSALNH